MKQVTLISLYDQKSTALYRLIQHCIEQIQQSPLRSFFQAYPIKQIHGTIIGLEKSPDCGELFNHNIAAATQKKLPMRFDHLLSTIQQHFPMSIQFGGFEPTFDQFLSLKQRPYLRSFQIQWQNNRVVLVGWPHIAGNFTHKHLLSAAREAFLEHCNIAHKYPDDNDLFMTLGEFSGLDVLSKTDFQQVMLDISILEKSLQYYLSQHKTDIVIDLDSLSIAQYQLPNLPQESTHIYSVNDVRINAEFIQTLYT